MRDIDLSNLSGLTDKQKQAALDLLQTVKDFAAWHENMPPIEKVGRVLVISTIAAREERSNEGVSEEELSRIWRWLQEKYVEITTIEGVLNGLLGIQFTADNDQPEFWLTKRGMRLEQEVAREEAEEQGDA